MAVNYQTVTETMAEYEEMIATELMLNKIEKWKRIGGCSSNNWAFKTGIGEIFTKISRDENVNKCFWSLLWLYLLLSNFL